MKKADPTFFAVFEYSDVTDKTGYWEFDVAYLGGSAAGFADDDDVIVTFSRAGSTGAGTQGAQGTENRQGTDLHGDAYRRRRRFPSGRLH